MDEEIFFDRNPNQCIVVYGLELPAALGRDLTDFAVAGRWNVIVSFDGLKG